VTGAAASRWRRSGALPLCSYCGEVNGVLGVIVPSILLRLLLLELQYLPLYNIENVDPFIA